MIKYKEYSYDEIISKISYENERIPFEVDGRIFNVKMGSQRYFLFKKQKCCAVCGIEGEKFVLETSDKKIPPHFNFYAIENGKDLLMTKDHIIPRSKGGEDNLTNYNTLCIICNNLKSNEFTYDQTFELRKIWNENCESIPIKDLRVLINDKQNVFRKV